MNTVRMMEDESVLLLFRSVAVSRICVDVVISTSSSFVRNEEVEGVAFSESAEGREGSELGIETNELYLK